MAWAAVCSKKVTLLLVISVLLSILLCMGVCLGYLFCGVTVTTGP